MNIYEIRSQDTGSIEEEENVGAGDAEGQPQPPAEKEQPGFLPERPSASPNEEGDYP